MDRANAALLAQCLTGAIRAPILLSSEIANELAMIEYTYGGEHPQIVDIPMRPPWGIWLIVEFDETTYAEVLNHQYDAWTELNEEYGVTDLEVLSLQPIAVLKFEEALNLCSLALEYSNLPGVTEAWNEPLAGEVPTILVKTDGANRDYLYFYGEGDCPAGCTYREYRYFRIVEYTAVPQFVGVRKSGDGEIPPWWEDAQKFFDACRCEESTGG